MRLAIGAVMLAAALTAACSKNDPDGNGGNPVGPSGVSNNNGNSNTTNNPTRPPQSGSIAFSTTASKGWNWIDVYVDNTYYGTIRRYYNSGGGPSSCLAENEARIVATVAVGSHSYSARTNTGGSWSGTQSISAGGCIEINLTCPSGDCSATR